MAYGRLFKCDFCGKLYGGRNAYYKLVAHRLETGHQAVLPKAYGKRGRK